MRYGFDDKGIEWFEGREYSVNCVDALEIGRQSIFDAIDEHYGKVAMDGYRSIKDVCVKAADGKYSAMGGWEDPDVWEAPESEFSDRALRNLSDGNGDVIALPPMAFQAGDSIIVHIDLDLSNRWSDSESECNLVGFYLDGEFTELFSGKVPGGGYDIPATMSTDGDLTFVIMNCSAGGQFYREISVMQPMENYGELWK